MRFAWCVEGDDPDFAEGDRHSIDGYFYPMDDALTTTSEVQKATLWSGGRAVGIYYGHNWHPTFTPGQIAAFIRGEYKRVTKNGTVLKQLRVMYNEEEHDPTKILAVLSQVRSALPGVGLSWSPEGMQGGWMSPEFVAEITRLRVRVVPQNFWGADGSIQGDWAADAVLRDLLKRGFKSEQVSLFWDGKTIDKYRNAEGFVFTMGRLPWLG